MVETTATDEDAEWDATVEERPTKKISEERKVPVADMIEKFLCNETLVRLNPNFTSLMVLYLVMTVASADCERGFSVMKRIKTAMRNRLGSAALEQLMCISINGPDIKEFDFLAAVRLFVNLKTRRLPTPIMTAASLRKEAEELRKYKWGDSATAEMVQAEAERDLAGVDPTRLFSGTAPIEGASSSTSRAAKRKAAAVEAGAGSTTKSGRELATERTLAIVNANNALDDGFEEEEMPETIGDGTGVACEACNLRTWIFGNDIVLCDGLECDNALHLSCMQPRLERVPLGKWFCPSCDAARERSSRGRPAQRKIIASM
jgi:hypothetical protein